MMNSGHVRAAALAAAVTMMLAGCAGAHRDVGLAASTMVACLPIDLLAAMNRRDSSPASQIQRHRTVMTRAP